MTHWTLSNGLRVYLLPADTPFSAVVLGYAAGAAHEPSNACGVAHLLEHLLFEDDEIAYDKKIQAVGGSTNAYTGKDYTVYYARLPREQVGLALELEAARLFDLRLTPEKIQIQRQVVAEEFRQRYLNPPYADRFFYLMRMAFPGHPYERMVIGESPEQVLAIPDTALHAFYEQFYAPHHAVLCVAGGGIEEGITYQIEALYSRPKAGSPLPAVPSVEGLPFGERLTVREAPVPQKAVIWAYRLPPAADGVMYAVDLLDDFIGEARSGFFTQRLVHEKRLASRLNSYLWQMHQGGLWVIEAYLPDTVSIAQYEEALSTAIEDLYKASLEEVLTLYRPMRYLALHQERAKVLGRATALVHAILAGHPEWYEAPLEPYQKLTPAYLHQVVQTYLTPERLVRLHYIPQS